MEQSGSVHVVVTPDLGNSKAELRVGSLFAGIGGFDLGLERAGLTIVWQCESDPFCRKVLARHWPHVPCFPDIRTLKGADVEWVDVLCGGFPCQDLSVAGKREGLTGKHSGLWSAFHRLICEIRPRYVIVENVTGLLQGGLDRVLGDLAESGHDAEWDCIPAQALGAPHRRDRVWIVAYPASEAEGRPGPRIDSTRWRANPSWGGDVAYSERPGLEGRKDPRQSEVTEPRDTGWWSFEPPICRVDDGLSDRVDRLHALGNALVPQIAEWIGRRIVSYEVDGRAC